MIEPRSEIVLPGEPMAETLAFFRERLGMRLESIVPADDPRQAVLAGGGLRVRLDSDHRGDAGLLQVERPPDAAPDAARELRAPNGTRIRLTQDLAKPRIPAPGAKAAITRRTKADPWVTGRAGMLYRDLIPGRLDGYLIASHIRIPDGGPVPDDVHFHDVRCQFIYCYRGWVRLVYEDQGEPFVMRAGDCVLQPPTIRHRVLEASDGLEVVELASPAVHVTTLDHDLQLPTSSRNPERAFDGQRFHWHQHQAATWQPDEDNAWQVCDLGIRAASNGIADVAVLRGGRTMECTGGALTFAFVLTGTCDLAIGAGACLTMRAGDCATIPAGQPFGIHNADEHFQLLRYRETCAK